MNADGEWVINPYTGRYIKTTSRTYTRLFPTGKIILDTQSPNPELRANAEWYYQALLDPERYGYKSVRGVRMSRTYDLNHTNKRLVGNPVRYEKNPHHFDYPGVDNGIKVRGKKKEVENPLEPTFKDRAEALLKKQQAARARIAELKAKADALPNKGEPTFKDRAEALLKKQQAARARVAELKAKADALPDKKIFTFKERAEALLKKQQAFRARVAELKAQADALPDKPSFKERAEALLKKQQAARAKLAELKVKVSNLRDKDEIEVERQKIGNKKFWIDLEGNVYDDDGGVIGFLKPNGKVKWY